METRKLIKFGGSSHIIAIPNAWIKKNSLSKGDTIYIEENGNNELILQSHNREIKEVKKKITINADNKIDDVKREIIAAYINNYSVIEIIGKTLKENSIEVEKIINNLVAIEIIEETSNRIVARDFLDITDVSIQNLVRRMDTIVRVMTEKIYDEDKKLAYLEIKNMDHGINKLRFLLFKVIKAGINDSNLARKMKLSNHNLLKIWLMVSYLEEIADELRRFMRFRKSAKLSKEERNKLGELFSDIKESYISIMEAYYKDDKQKAHEVSSQRDSHMRRCDEIFKKSKSRDLIPLTEKMKAIESWIRCIGRVIIND